MPVSAALPNVSPLKPLSQGSRPLVVFPASAGAALRPGAAHEHEPAAAHEAGPVWHAHSVPCVPSSEPPQPAAQLPWSGPEQLGQAVLLLEVTPAPVCHLHFSYSARLTTAPAASAASGYRVQGPRSWTLGHWTHTSLRYPHPRARDWLGLLLREAPGPRA